MNILLGAYACEPNKGSEPEVGWQMANEIAVIRPDDTIHVVTKTNNKEVIELETYSDNLSFHYYAPPKWLTFWKKGGRGVRTYYYIWMLGAALHMKAKNISFDVVHHITFVNDWLPSFFFLLKTKNNRFIWGPIGSHDPIDTKFLDGKKIKSLEAFRIFLQKFMRNVDPFFHYCKAKSDCIIGINEHVSTKLNLKSSQYFVVEPAISLKKKVVESTSLSTSDKTTFRIVSIGRLLYIKNFKLTLVVFSKFLKSNPDINHVKLQIIGDGGDRSELQLLAQSLGIIDYVEFTGNIPLHEVQTHLSQADIFLFPTLENAGFVILEAMSHSLPVLAMEYGGPQQFIKHNISKQLVSVDLPYDEIASRLSEKLEYFHNYRKQCRQVGERNRQDIIDNFTWEAKAKKLSNIYQGLV